MERTLPLPQLDSTALQTVVLHLGAAGKGNLPASCSRALHAQVLEWFRLGQPEIAQAIHDSQESPISLSGLIGKQPGTTVQEGDVFYIRLGLLHGSLLVPLLRGLEQQGQSAFCLAQFPFVIKGIDLLPGTNSWSRSSDYALLVQTPTVLKSLTLKFLSPTSFKFNSGHHIQPLPLPEAVFGNLQRRWNAFAPATLHFPKRQWQGLICNYELKAQMLRIENSDELGSIGWVTYRFPDPEQARVAGALAKFAFFAGVGRKTAMGMGQVVLED